nr:competence type IV pilus minor pilin ComGD [Bacillus piscicola]
MVIVLLIITVTIGIPILTFHSFQNQKEIDYFIELLAEDLRYAQQYAYAHEKMIFLESDKTSYALKESVYSKPLLLRKIPAGVKFDRGTISTSEIIYNHNGNIRKPGTFYIRTAKNNYKVVLLLGRGRFYVEKM